MVIEIKMREVNDGEKLPKNYFPANSEELARRVESIAKTMCDRNKVNFTDAKFRIVVE